MVTSSQELLQKAIEAAKAKRPAEALRILKEVVLLEPRNETAWLWLSRLLESDKQRIVCLRNVLVINPDNEAARLELNILKERAATIEPVREGAEEPAALVVPGTAAPGVASERAAAEAHEATPAIQSSRVDSEDKTRVDTEGQRKGSGCALFVLGGVGGVFLLLLGFLLAWALGIIELPGGAPPFGPIYATIEEPTAGPPMLPTQQPTATALVLPTEEPAATATAAAASADSEYLVCYEDTVEDLVEILTEIDSTLTIAGGRGYDFDFICAEQVSWPRKLSELRADHAACPFPTDQRLRAVRENLDKALEERALSLDCLRTYCESGDSRWTDEAYIHVEQADLYGDRARREMQLYMAHSG